MTASYLTTDIVVIIVLVVVLVVIGLCAFFIHYYWTKVGVSEIWNTEKWSSIRSSFRRSFRRFSQASTKQFLTEQPDSRASVYSDDSSHVPVNDKNSNPIITSYYVPKTITPSSSNNYTRSVSIVGYDQSGKPNHATKINTIHQYNQRYNDPSLLIQKQRF